MIKYTKNCLTSKKYLHLSKKYLDLLIMKRDGMVNLEAIYFILVVK